MSKMQGSAAFSGTMFVIFLAVSQITAFAGTFAFFDFDETLMKCRDHGLFKTPVRLFPVEMRNNMLTEIPTGAHELEVTCSDYEGLRRFLAQSPRQLGSIEGTFQLEDGTEIVPGHFYFDASRSFNPYYGEHPGKGNYLLESWSQAQAAIKASADPKKAASSLFAAAWPIFQVLTRTAEDARSVGITTARWHSKPEVAEFWQAVIKDGHLKFPPNPELHSGVSRAEFDRYDRDPSHIAERKVGYWAEFARNLRRVSLTEKDEKLNPDGTGTGRYHTLYILEDNTPTQRKTIRALTKIVQSRNVPLKVIIANFAPEAEVVDAAAAGIPRYAVINSTGNLREATPHEVFGESASISPEEATQLMKLLPKQVGMNCVSALKRKVREKK